ncbi:peptidase associated domain and porin domain-containing protein [Pedobacter caeni]|uniref:Outer membrane receptor proteins, mostly Fe transport n=1 Tax=Pedobacter caeni TaxID=288992 RepID=A0A1M5C113_9SPHI|nr:hypothetical protein [Pedobacter caeni]SHF48429.1 hypothetical protein SAMN04488522_1021448 [Pedobacter caeni]
MNKKTAVIVLMLICFFGYLSFGQSNSNPVKGLLRGIVKDKESKSAVSAATVTIYLQKDSAILTYLFTKANGSFKLEGLPLDSTLTLSLSHVNYTTFYKKIRFSSKVPEIELGELFLLKRENNLEEVKIVAQRPPMVMRGDTLEINAEAFKTKENAVVEDMLRKVPGIVVWGDGKITVNGKAVSRLLVEGKPFFGSDPVIAMRNLPKDIIDKVQVYNDQSHTDSEIRTPTVTMNIALKEGKKKGLFGKIGAGIGTEGRYEGNVALNAFTPKSQLSLMAATNNTNKETYSIDDMLRLSVYKPGGSDNSKYQSDFYKQGLNKFSAWGFNYDLDVNKAVTSKSRYFGFRSNNETLKDVNEVVSLTDDVLKRNNVENGSNYRYKHSLRSSIGVNKKFKSFFFAPEYEESNSGNKNENKSNTLNGTGSLLSEYNTKNDFSDHNKRLKLYADFRSSIDTKLYQDFYLKYEFENNRYHNENTYSTMLREFSSNGSPKNSTDFNRRSLFDQTGISQSLYGEVNVSQFLRIARKIQTKLINNASQFRQSNDHLVYNLDAQSGAYTSLNSYLSNQSTYQILTERPGIKFNGNFGKNIAQRSDERLSFEVLMEMQVIGQRNKSEKSFQNISRTYHTALPSANLTYAIQKAGKYERSFSLGYYTSAEIPGIENLAPLVDSAQQVYMKIGNRGLKQQYQQSVRLNFSNNRPGKGMFKLDIEAGAFKDGFTDSSFYDHQGRRVGYTMNLDGRKYINFSGQYMRSFKMFSAPLSILLMPYANFSENPYYLNGLLSKSDNANYRVLGKINYVLSESMQLDLDAGTSWYTNRIKSESGTQKLSFNYRSIGSDFHLSWPKRVTLVNQMHYNINESTGAKSVQNLIWNINLYYRMLKKEQLELKFSANDLLRQRTNVISYVDNNTISLGTVNNLQQFFMFSVAFYPRQFGSK